VRLLWCRRRADQLEVGSAVTARHGPDIQCYLAGTRAPEEGGFSLQCWPVARGAGAAAPFIAPDPGSSGGAPGAALALSVSAPGAATAELRGGPRGSVTVARAPVAADGYARIALPATAVRPEWILDSEGTVVLLDARGRTVGRLMVAAQDHGDAWGDRLDGPVDEPYAPQGSPASGGSGGRGWEGLVQ
jgi:hypothetical protein